MFKIKIVGERIENPIPGDMFIYDSFERTEYLIKEVYIDRDQIRLVNVTDGSKSGWFTYSLSAWKANIRDGAYKLLKPN